MGLLGKSGSAPQAAASLLAFLNRRIYRNILIGLTSFACIAVFLTWDHIPSRRKSELPRLPMWPDVPKAHSFPTVSEFQPVALDPTNKTTEELCASFPSHLLASVQPILKTGYTEDRRRFEATMDTVSACFAPGELLIFSDLPSSERGHDVIDILATLPDTYTSLYDFHIYRDQKEMKANGTLDSDPDAAKRIKGWAMDKFKFLPGIQKAWDMKPNKDFYVFYESDTYIFWDNMFRLLQSLDPDQPLYFGSPSPGRFSRQREQGTMFANGGPGYVLSRAAMKKLLHRRSGPTGHYIDPPFTERWRHLLHKGECCGDSALGWVAFENEIMLQGYYPMFSPYVLPILRYDNKHWCEPVVTLHKPSPDEFYTLFNWEYEHRKFSSPLMYSDLWQYHQPGTVEMKQNWDNKGEFGTRAPEEANIDSFDACGQYCRDQPGCMQWVWRGQETRECWTHNLLRHGRKKSPETVQGKTVDYTSGWLVDRAGEWRSSMNCSAPHWVGPSLSRIF